MDKYVLVFLLTQDREKVLLKNVNGKFAPLFIIRNENQFADEIAFDAVKTAGVTGVKRLFYVESLDKLKENIHVAVYAGTMEEKNITWSDNRTYLFSIANILKPSTTLTGTGYYGYSGFHPQRKFMVGNGEIEQLLEQSIEILKPDPRYIVA